MTNTWSCKFNPQDPNRIAMWHWRSETSLISVLQVITVMMPGGQCALCILPTNVRKDKIQLDVRVQSIKIVTKSHHQFGRAHYKYNSCVIIPSRGTRLLISGGFYRDHCTIKIKTVRLLCGCKNNHVVTFSFKLLSRKQAQPLCSIVTKLHDCADWSFTDRNARVVHMKRGSSAGKVLTSL